MPNCTWYETNNGRFFHRSLSPIVLIITYGRLGNVFEIYTLGERIDSYVMDSSAIAVR